MKRLKGQITIFLSLVLMAILGLAAAMIYHSIYTAKLAIAECSTDVAVSSLFAQYNRRLLEEYDLFYLDMQQLNCGVSMEGLADKCREMADKHISTDNYDQITGRINMLQLSTPSVSCKGYSLASDDFGAVYRQQAVSHMRSAYPVTLLKILKELTGSSRTADSRSNIYTGCDNVAKGGTGALKKSYMSKAGSDTHIDIEGYMNNVHTNGLLNYVWKRPVSGRSINTGELVSHRAGLNQGIGIYRRLNNNALEEKLLFNEYLLEHFGNAVHGLPDRALSYETEYILSGKDSDIKNLKSVVNKLLLMREAANYVYLISDSAKRSEAEALGLALATAATVPEASEIFTQLVLVGWAFGESLLDIRDLLDGHKVPPIKNGNSFKLQLTNITNPFGQKYEKSSDPSALDYKGYLRLLLLMHPKKDVSLRSMDLIEANMRKDAKHRGFRMDACVEWAKLELTYSIHNNRVYSRKYGYVQ